MKQFSFVLMASVLATFLTAVASLDEPVAVALGVAVMGMMASELGVLVDALPAGISGELRARAEVDEITTEAIDKPQSPCQGDNIFPAPGGGFCEMLPKDEPWLAKTGLKPRLDNWCPAPKVAIVFPDGTPHCSDPPRKLATRDDANVDTHEELNVICPDGTEAMPQSEYVYFCQKLAARSPIRIDYCNINGKPCLSNNFCCSNYCIDQVCQKPPPPACRNDGDQCTTTQCCNDDCNPYTGVCDPAWTATRVGARALDDHLPGSSVEKRCFGGGFACTAGGECCTGVCEALSSTCAF